MAVRALPLALAAAIVATALAHPARQSTTPTGTALIIGRVVDGTTGAAVSGAVVTLAGPGAPKTGGVLVDSLGRFLFRGLPAGSFTIAALKSGYAPGAYGRLRPSGQTQSLVLRDGDRQIDVTLRVWKYGSIAGTVVDEANEPVVGVEIQAFQRTFVAGHPSYSLTGTYGATDDRGMYHVAPLEPGDYLIGVTPRSVTYPITFVEASDAARQAGGAIQQARTAELTAKGSNQLWMGASPAAARVGDLIFATDRWPAGLNPPAPVAGRQMWVYPTTFLTAARTPDRATVIAVEAGQERTGVNLQLRIVPAVRISGTVAGPDGPVANYGLRLQLAGRGQFRSAGADVAQTVTDAKGAFTFLGVAAGEYVVSTGAGMMGSMNQSATTSVTVGEKDLTDVSVELRPIPRISGRVEFDGTTAKPSPAQYRLLAIGLDGADGRITRLALPVDANLNIPPRVVEPGRYFVRVDPTLLPPGGAGAMAGWALKSAIVNGRDVSDASLSIDAADIDSLVVTFTDHPSTLAGTVRNAQGAADPAAAVLVFATDRSMWVDCGARPRRLQNVRADRTGAFTIAGLPPGEYFVVALPEDVTRSWQDPAFLERAAQMATRVKIAEEGSVAIDVRTVRW